MSVHDCPDCECDPYEGWTIDQKLNAGLLDHTPETLAQSQRRKIFQDIYGPTIERTLREQTLFTRIVK
jgi:hypothetical protein